MSDNCPRCADPRNETVSPQCRARHEPTPDQRAALLKFRQMHGRRWKSWLRCAWMNGVYPTYCIDNGDDCLLQQVRNQLGPNWLARWVP